MGLIAELGRLAIGAWSPGGAGGGYIAAATFGAPDTSLSTDPRLELVSVDISCSKLTVVTDVPTPERFTSVDWSGAGGQHPAGLIAGGLCDGTVRVWDAATLLRSTQSNDPNRGVLFGGVSAAKKHAGAVRSLAFNPFMPTRLASGGADGSVLVWDLGNPSTGPNVRHPAEQLPKTSGAPRDEITAVAWNRKVPHILASATSGGVMSVWDLKQSKQVISIRNPRGRFPCSSLTWHPEIATQVVITCDDESTGALIWDLRNASAPIRTYSHHSPKGVVSSSWSNFDTDLLLTSSRDSRTVVVSVTTADIVAEAPKSANWNFDVKWSPRIPGLYLASSFDGRLTVNSMMTATTAPSVSSETVSALAESFGEMAGDFHSGIGEQSPRSTETQKVSYNVTRPPKWFRKPSGVSFGFGGLRASVSSKNGASTVTVESLDEKVSGLPEGSSKLDSILMDLTSEDPSPALRWCAEASSAAEMPKERMVWDVLGLMFQTDARRKLLSYLGFEVPPPDAGDEIAMPVYGLARSQALAVPVRPVSTPVVEVSDNKIDTVGQITEITNGAGAMNLEGPAPWEVSDASGDNVNLKDSILDGDDTGHIPDEVPTNKQNGSSEVSMNGSKAKSFSDMSRRDIEELIKKAVIVGDFSTAVDACLHIDQTAEALVIAHAGGPDLWQNTQAQYLTRASLSHGASIIGAIAGPKSKMDDYIRQSAETDKDSWKESLAVILTYTPAEDLSQACTSLGERLMFKSEYEAALFCFICANNTKLATSAWMRERPSVSRATSAMMAYRTERLVALVDKIRLLTAATLLAQGEREIGAVRAMDPVSGAVLCEFGALLAVSGNLSSAITYLSNLDPSYSCMYGSAEELHMKASETLAIVDSVALSSSQTTGEAGFDTFGGAFQQPSSTRHGGESMYGQAGQDLYAPPQASPAMWNAPAAPAVPSIPPPYTANLGGVKQYVPPARPAPSAAVNSPPPPPQSAYSSYSGTTGTAERAANDPSAVYGAAPAYSAGAYSAPALPPAPSSGLNATNATTSSPSQYASTIPPVVPPPPMPTATTSSPSQYASTIPPVVPPPPMPTATTSSPSQYASAIPPVVPPPPMPTATPTAPSAPSPAVGYGLPPSIPPDMSSGLGMAPPPLVPQPPPPPPTDSDAPPPIPYHANARPGSGATLPPSAEVAVAETRRSKPLSSSGTPGGPPRRTNSTSSSLSALGIETVLLEKADASKVPANQQVIVKSLRGSYMYARSRSDAPRYKKKMDDVSKRLGKLVAALNNGILEPAVVELLVTFGQDVENGNYDEASLVVSKLTKHHWDANSQWIQGLKRLIDCVLTGR